MGQVMSAWSVPIGIPGAHDSPLSSLTASIDLRSGSVATAAAQGSRPPAPAGGSMTTTSPARSSGIRARTSLTSRLGVDDQDAADVPNRVHDHGQHGVDFPAPVGAQSAVLERAWALMPTSRSARRGVSANVDDCLQADGRGQLFGVFGSWPGSWASPVLSRGQPINETKFGADRANG